MIRAKSHLYFSNGGKVSIWTLESQKIRWRVERTKLLFCFVTLWFFGAWLMTVVCWDLAMTWSIHFFLPVLCCVLLRSISRKELLPFHTFFARWAFLPLLKYPVFAGPSGSCCVRELTLLHSSSPALLVGGWSQLLQGEQRQRACEYSVPTTWAPTRSGARVLWEQSISCSLSHSHTLILSHSHL